MSTLKCFLTPTDILLAAVVPISIGLTIRPVRNLLPFFRVSLLISMLRL